MPARIARWISTPDNCRAARSVFTTFTCAFAIYVANHATEMHFAPWLATLFGGLSAALAAISVRDQQN